jgi:hypothetical protein
MADQDSDDGVADDYKNKFVDLTTPANQTWLDGPSSRKPLRLLEDEVAIKQWCPETDESYSEITGEEPE